MLINGRWLLLLKRNTNLSRLYVLLFRCKTNQQTQDLSAEEMSAIKDMQDSIKERPDIFFDMEAFLPKKNGFDILLTVLCILVTLYTSTTSCEGD